MPLRGLFKGVQDVEDVILSEEYQQANKAHSEAFNRYVQVLRACLAGKLTEKEFIAAQKEYFAALVEWELAYEKERN
jgi:hypothetical protein